MVFYFNMIVLYFVTFVSFQGLSSNGQLQSEDLYSPWFRRKVQFDLNLTYFHRLEGYHVDANLVKDPTTYPWIAKVVHSRRNAVPYLCTASCVDKFIFITSARCVYLLKIKFTSLLHQNQRLTVKALVRPSKESQQLYDDIAFIVVDDEPVNFKWITMKVYEETRTDDAFFWYDKKDLDKLDYVVVGYTRDKKSSAYPVWQSNYQLTELHVVMDMRLCSNILPFAKGTSAFNVLCYHSCSLDAFDRKDLSCLRYHGVDGGAVVNVKTNTIMGVATWGSFYHEFELPVGVAMTNTDTYSDDFNCAKRIRDHKGKQVTLGFYQSLCDKLKKSMVK